jgi:hypothetical protein
MRNTGDKVPWIRHPKTFYLDVQLEICRRNFQSLVEVFMKKICWQVARGCRCENLFSRYLKVLRQLKIHYP